MPALITFHVLGHSALKPQTQQVALQWSQGPVSCPLWCQLTKDGAGELVPSLFHLCTPHSCPENLSPLHCKWSQCTVSLNLTVNTWRAGTVPPRVAEGSLCVETMIRGMCICLKAWVWTLCFPWNQVPPCPKRPVREVRASQFLHQGPSQGVKGTGLGGGVDSGE